MMKSYRLRKAGHFLSTHANQKEFLELRGGHNDGFLSSGRSYVDGLDAFLASVSGN